MKAWLSVLLVCLLVILCAMFVYIRLSFPFWAKQPVFHVYDMHLWMRNRGILRPGLPTKQNRFINTTNIQTLPFDRLSPALKADGLALIQTHYLAERDNRYFPREEHVFPYFDGHFAPSFWSLYSVPSLLAEGSTGRVVPHSNVVGVMTSRPLHVWFPHKGKGACQTTKNKREGKGRKEKDQEGEEDGKEAAEENKMDVYYVDWLCVHKNWRGKQIAPQLIQTHEYAQSHANKRIAVSLFKREEELTGIVPVTAYQTVAFFIRSRPLLRLHASLRLLEGDALNTSYLYEFVAQTMKHCWSLLVLPELSNVLALVASRNVYARMLMRDKTILAVYLFRTTRTWVSQDAELLSCVASVKSDEIDPVLFVEGFDWALQSVLAKQAETQEEYKGNNQQNPLRVALSIENISHNHWIVDHVSQYEHPFAVSPTAYFWYNFAYHTFPAGDCFVLS